MNEPDEYIDGTCPECGEEASGYALQTYGHCDLCEHQGWHGPELAGEL
ncbi:hypothetical protein GCM10011369_23130 [Neiella marina]|uniref:Uncharacterized protein n=1 Tax=Neiella marina TaxID=508461 RepID=A0A8J2XPE2_9GAMM|nr:hypothetical protein [Neiella marina]GGA80579.1 hypothetical protein GCM10011369_23130 [Neiella marina]